MIDVEDLSVAFGDTIVFDSLTTHLPEGRFVGLVGPNGAGKSTLLRTISGAVKPDEGHVSIDGVTVDERTSREQSRLVSVVPQDTSLAFSFEVRHFVEMGRTPYRSRFTPPDETDRARVDDALARTETAQFETRTVDELSGGERQRVVLARALAQDTPVILLDEPTASLDVNHQVEVLSLVSDLVASGKTVVAAIHDLDLAARFCDELLVLSDGAIVERGAPERVLDVDTIETAFGATGVVTTNPVTWTPSVTTLPSSNDRTSIPDRIHVVGTGPHTAAVLATLRTTESTLSIGPVPAGDAAAVTAKHLDVDRQVVPSLSGLDDPAIESLETTLGSVAVAVAVPNGALDSAESVWNSLRAVQTVAVYTPDSERRSPTTASALERLLSRSIETTPDGLLTALASLDERDPVTVSPEKNSDR